MAKFHDLLARVADEGLRAALQTEYDQMTKHKKFGLVFEEHLPECTPLWGMKIRRGMTVARKDGNFNDVLQVQRIKDGVATCWHAAASEAEDIALEDLIPIARFGDPIYPVLTPIDAVENAPGGKRLRAAEAALLAGALRVPRHGLFMQQPIGVGARPDCLCGIPFVDRVVAQPRLELRKLLDHPLRTVAIEPAPPASAVCRHWRRPLLRRGVEPDVQL